MIGFAIILLQFGKQISGNNNVLLMKAVLYIVSGVAVFLYLLLSRNYSTNHFIINNSIALI